LQAFNAYDAGMKRKQSVQYTIRGVSRSLDRCIREKATREERSLNDLAVSLLERGMGLSADSVRYTDLDDLAGSWVNDPAFDEAVERLHRVDRGLWR
jgi:hypothetical protein